MLINAMEASGIEGTYRIISEDVMRVLRENNEALLAVLEAFAHDPLVNWRWTEQKIEDTEASDDTSSLSPVLLGSSPQGVNERAVAVINRIEDKLHGDDFETDASLNVEDQVDRLIKQATDTDNLCKSFMGWCPFW